MNGTRSNVMRLCLSVSILALFGSVSPALAQQQEPGRCAAAEKAYRGALVQLLRDRVALLAVTIESNGGKRPPAESAFVEARFTSRISDQIAGINVLLSWMQLERCPAPTPLPDFNRASRIPLDCWAKREAAFSCTEAKAEEEAILQGR